MRPLEGLIRGNADAERPKIAMVRRGRMVVREVNKTLRGVEGSKASRRSCWQGRVTDVGSLLWRKVPVC